jgi:hypothetical protein
MEARIEEVKLTDGSFVYDIILPLGHDIQVVLNVTSGLDAHKLRALLSNKVNGAQIEHL